MNEIANFLIVSISTSFHSMRNLQKWFCNGKYLKLQKFTWQDIPLLIRNHHPDPQNRFPKARRCGHCRLQMGGDIFKIHFNYDKVVEKQRF